MVCEKCPNYRNCSLLKEYRERGVLIESGEIEALKDLYYKLDLHEAYASELRKRVLSELNRLKFNNPSES
jgi:hypothetical protein